MVERDLLIALCQISSEVGDIETNLQNVIKYVRLAKDSNAQIIVFPEMVLAGYLPLDLIFYDSFRIKIETAIEELVAISEGF